VIVHNNPYFSVKVIDDYYSIVFPTKQVAILPVVDNNHILFIQAIRPVFNKMILELPAGTVESGESLETAAMRELEEETGIRIEDSSRLKALPSLNIMPSRTAQMLQIYQINITKEEYEKRVNHDQEVSGTILLTFDEVIEKINDGEIFVASFVATCLTYIINN